MGDYIFDIIILVLLVLFAWRGAVKGLILSLCGLAAIFVAFFAAQFVSETFCEPVGNILRPIIIQALCRKGLYSSRFIQALYAGSEPLPAFFAGRFFMERSCMAFWAFSMERLKSP